MKENAKKILCVVFSLLTCGVMISSILLFPTLKIKSVSLGTYWMVVLVGMIIVVGISGVKIKKIGDKLIEDTAVNPLKILALFISMTILSVYIDEMGFFQYLANFVLSKAKASQKKLFIYLFLMVSILTVFTSNDVIILAFTPFICYFAKSAGINPMPYLINEFVAANSWSMTLIIGNPTNIYLGTANDVSFVTYLKVMIVPTLFAGITAFTSLYLMNRKELSIPIADKQHADTQAKTNNIERVEKTTDTKLKTKDSATQVIVHSEYQLKNKDKNSGVEIYDNSPVTQLKENEQVVEIVKTESQLKDTNQVNEGVEKSSDSQLKSKTSTTEVVERSDNQVKDKALLIIGVVHLVVCVILLAIGSYIDLEMWIVTLACAGSLMIFVLITSAIKKRPPIELGKTLLRAPWELIPFVLGMFIIIVVIQELGITDSIGDFLGSNVIIPKYGAIAFIACNIINNIPMSVFFCAVMDKLKGNALKQAIYSTVVASNIGAFFTPIGALAGIMFTSILAKFEIKFGYLDFLKMGVFVALPTIVVCLIALYLMLMAYY